MAASRTARAVATLGFASKADTASFAKVTAFATIERKSTNFPTAFSSPIDMRAFGNCSAQLHNWRTRDRKRTCEKIGVSFVKSLRGFFIILVSLLDARKVASNKEKLKGC